jgi:hypothetical protein
MQFAEPHRIEAEGIAKLDLRHDIPVTLLLGVAGSARQLVEKPEAYAFLPTPLFQFGSPQDGTSSPWRERAEEPATSRDIALCFKVAAGFDPESLNSRASLAARRVAKAG